MKLTICICSTNNKKEMSYTSSPTVCLHGVDREFTFFLLQNVISSHFPLFDVAFRWIAHISPQI